MQEVEGLTVAAIDWIREGIQKQGGQSAYPFYNPETCRGCALGSIGHLTMKSVEKGWEKGALAKAVRVGLAASTHSGCLSEAANEVSRRNTYILEDYLDPQYDKERGRLILSWLREQREMKCSNWTPPIKEVGRKRELVSV